MEDAARTAGNFRRAIAGKIIIAAMAALAVFWGGRAAAQDDTFGMSLDELLNTPVVSVTRSSGMTLFDAPASLHVISSEDIRRGGLLYIPELMRLAPGLLTSRLDASTWGISARGFNNRYNRMQLVQMDGRSLYNSLFGGVFWADQDFPLDDLDRIEVIRGPGASLWGANAASGIISIISKPAKETQGWLVRAHGGSHDRGIGTIRYGGKTSDGAYWRAYFKQDEHGGFDTYSYNKKYFPVAGAAAADTTSFFTPDKSDDLYSYTDAFRRTAGGFRYDREQARDSYTAQGDFFNVNRGDSMPYAKYTVLAPLPAGAIGNTAPINLGTLPTGEAANNNDWGWNLLARWTHKVSDSEQTQLQAFYDTVTVDYRSPNVTLNDKIRVYDLDFQHNFTAWKKHKIVWGANYKKSTIDNAFDSFQISFDPDKYNKDTLNGFVQDSFPVFNDEYEMTVGTKLERNDYTGEEAQPSARITYKPNKSNVLWGAVSKAVRTPSVTDDGMNLVVGGAIIPANAFGAGNPPIDMWMPATVVKNPDMLEEEIISYELGYRTMPTSRLSIDASVYINRGHHMTRPALISSALDMPVYKYASSGTMRYAGAEVTGNLLVTNRWRLTAGYSYFEADEQNQTEIEISGRTPRNQAQLRSYHDLNDRLEFNTALYYTDNLLRGALPKTLKLDSGLTWKSKDGDFSVSLQGQNLLTPKLRESPPDGYTSLGAAEIERSAFIELVWKR